MCLPRLQDDPGTALQISKSTQRNAKQRNATLLRSSRLAGLDTTAGRVLIAQGTHVATGYCVCSITNTAAQLWLSAGSGATQRRPSRPPAAHPWSTLEYHYVTW